MRTKSEIKRDINSLKEQLKALKGELKASELGFEPGNVLVRDNETFKIVYINEDSYEGTYIVEGRKLTHEELTYRWKRQ